MDVVRLYFGSMDGPLGPATPWQGYAITHPQGVILVDTGFGPTFGDGISGVLNPPTMDPPPNWTWVRRSTIDALADHGLHGSDVKYIVNTHLGDHSGDNKLFPEAQFIIQAPEAEYARKRHPHVREEWDFDGAKIEQLACEDVEILPGVTCLFTPGHTPGHQSILVEEEGSKTLLVGDLRRHLGDGARAPGLELAGRAGGRARGLASIGREGEGCRRGRDALRASARGVSSSLTSSQSRVTIGKVQGREARPENSRRGPRPFQ
jgi:glyoxylase-like metal-dependent hydrolase (beta-lactamase superfamily II)